MPHLNLLDIMNGIIPEKNCDWFNIWILRIRNPDLFTRMFCQKQKQQICLLLSLTFPTLCVFFWKQYRCADIDTTFGKNRKQSLTRAQLYEILLWHFLLIFFQLQHTILLQYFCQTQPNLIKSNIFWKQYYSYL